MNKQSILVPGLTILFFYLKLTNQIDWSWWWVCSPLLVSLAMTTLLFKRLFKKTKAIQNIIFQLDDLLSGNKKDLKGLLKDLSNSLESTNVGSKSKFRQRLDDEMKRAEKNNL